MLNPKEREVSSLDGKVGYLWVMYVLYPMVWRELLQFGMITKHTLRVRNWWKKLKNLTHFHPKSVEN